VRGGEGAKSQIKMKPAEKMGRDERSPSEPQKKVGDCLDGDPTRAAWREERADKEIAKPSFYETKSLIGAGTKSRRHEKKISGRDFDNGRPRGSRHQRPRKGRKRGVHFSG